MLVSSSVTLPNGYRTSFVASATSALGTANAIANALNQTTSPVTAVVVSGGSASAASVALTSKTTGSSQNGAITVSLVATQVKAAPASMSGGGGATYDAGTVMATIGNAAFTVSYGQTSTAQTVASALASAINAGSAGVTATASSGSLTVTANTPGTMDNGVAVTLNSSSSEPSIFSSPSFTGTSGTLGGGTGGTFSPGTIYSYSIPSTPTATTGYAYNGNLLSFAEPTNSGQWTATYDTLNRLSSATLAGPPSTTLGWTYDVFGNRTQQTPGGTLYTYPAGNNRISGYTYDASGHVLDDGGSQFGFQYGYDGEGRLCTVYNKALAIYTHYAYDGMGNRVAKGTGMNSLSCDNSFTPASNFVEGANGEQLDELNATGLNYSNVFANGQLLATYSFSGANWTYALNDWLGTKRVVANSDGTVAESCTGFPYGDNQFCTGTGGGRARNTLGVGDRYSGRPFDRLGVHRNHF